MSKSIVQVYYRYSVQKTARKNTKYSRNETILKIGPLAKSIIFAWAIAFAKYLIWAKNLSCLKHVKIDSASLLEIFRANSRSKNTQIFQKWDDFENRPSCKVYSLCMGYSLCKILILGQKLKLPKTCQNRFCNLIRIILRKKPLEKNTKYSRNKTILKIGPPAKSIAFAWAIAFAKYLIWAKNLNSLKHDKIDSAS